MHTAADTNDSVLLAIISRTSARPVVLLASPAISVRHVARRVTGSCQRRADVRADRKYAGRRSPWRAHRREAWPCVTSTGHKDDAVIVHNLLQQAQRIFSRRKDDKALSVGEAFLY